MDYYSAEAMWLRANLAAVRRFPQALFLPGFWAEYGMCTEPSAFGARCTWAENDLPFAHKVIESLEDVSSLRRPDPRTDGLLPFVLKRLQHARGEIETYVLDLCEKVGDRGLKTRSFLARAGLDRLSSA